MEAPIIELSKCLAALLSRGCWPLLLNADFGLIVPHFGKAGRITNGPVAILLIYDKASASYKFHTNQHLRQIRAKLHGIRLTVFSPNLPFDIPGSHSKNIQANHVRRLDNVLLSCPQGLGGV
jgi:hypothetical protein